MIDLLEQNLSPIDGLVADYEILGLSFAFKEKFDFFLDSGNMQDFIINNILDVSQCPEGKIRSIDGFAPDTISTPFESGIMGFLIPKGCIEVQQYVIKDDIDFSVFDEKASMQKGNKTKIDEIGSIIFSPNRPFQILSSSGNYICVVISLRRSVPFQWVFDIKKGEPLFQVACSTSGARIETLIDLLIAMNDGDISKSSATNVLDILSYHPLHFIRWKAVQALSEFDSEMAMHRLTGLVSDPHPLIRDTALEVIRENT